MSTGVFGALRAALKRSRHKDNPPRFRAWCTLTIGTHKSMEDLLGALANDGFRVSDDAVEILKKVTLASAKTEIDLLLVTGAELGFNKPVQRDAIYDRAKEFGLHPVPAEVAVHLRRKYYSQPMSECIAIAIDPIANSEGIFNFLVLVCTSSGQWLDAVCSDSFGDYAGIPPARWNPATQWVFTRRNSTQD